MDKSRILIFKDEEYILDEGYPIDQLGTCHPCDKCELSDLCDRISDDLNKIEYTLCTDIEDKEYKINHPNAYFMKIV